MSAMRVYLVEEGVYAGCYVAGIYSTLEKR